MNFSEPEVNSNRFKFDLRKKNEKLRKYGEF